MKASMIIKGLMAAAVAAILTSGAQAAKIDIASGATHALTAEENVSGNTLAFAGDATLALAGDVADGTFEINAAILFEGAGTVTFDTSALEGCTRILSRRHVRDNGRGGTLAFPAGVTEFRLGSASRGEDWALNFPSFEADATFAEAGGKVVFENDAAVVRLPQAYAIVAGSRIATFCANFFGDGDEFTLTDFDVQISALASFKAGSTVKVPSGRTLYVRPMELLAATPETGELSPWRGLAETVAVDVKLEAADAKVSFQNNAAATFAGAITGTGVLEFGGSADVELSGGVAKTVKILMDNPNSTAEAKYVVTPIEGETELPDAEFNLLRGCNVYFRPIGYGTRETELKVGKFKALSVTNKEFPTTVYGYEKETLRIGTLEGRVRLAGSGGVSTKVVIDTLAAGSALWIQPGIEVTLGSCATGAAVIFEAPEGVENPVWSFVGPSEGSPVAPAFDFRAANGRLTVGGKVAPTTAVQASYLTLLAGSELTADVPKDVKIVNLGGALVLPGTWRDRALLWNDATAAASLVYAKPNLATQLGIPEGDVRIGYINKHLADDQVVDWLDCRSDHQGRRFRVTRYDPDGSILSDAANVFTLFPKVRTQDGMTAFYLDKSKTRDRIYAATGFNGKSEMKVRCAVFTFNGAQGGGNALFTSAGKTFLRVSALDNNNYPTIHDPIVYDNTADLSFRKNGAAVDCTQTGLDAGWQVLAFTSETGVSISAIGPANTDGGNLDSTSYNGGQIFGEIIFFSDVPTPDEILDMEKYLADKWGVEIDHSGPAAQSVELFGKGATDLTALSAEAHGAYSGTINLNGNHLTIPSGEFPFAEDEIPSADRVLWIDPSLANALHYGADAQRPEELDYLLARDNDGLLTAADSLYGVLPYSDAQNRRIRAKAGFRDDGPVLPWLEFANGYNKDTYSNALFFRKLPYTALTNYADPVQELLVKAGFFAMDSSLGGGTVLGSQANGGGAFAARTEDQVKNKEPIFNGNCSADVKAASAWLDGVEIDPATDTYSLRPEVFAFNMADAASAPKVKTVGTFISSGQTAISNPEILGEFILYSKTQTEETCRRISAYLMAKWLGRLPEGFNDFHRATVTGAGVLTAEGPEYLPVLGDGFTGSVELTRTAWNFGLKKAVGETDGLVDLSGRALKLPAQVTINVTARGASNGLYPLFRFGTLASETEFVLGTTAGGDVELVVEEGVVYAKNTKLGALLLVR